MTTEIVTFEDTTQDQPNPQSGYSSVDITTVNDYQFIEEAFKGTGGFKDGTYLKNHHREMFYDIRRSQAHYANYVRPVVTAMYKAVFSEKITREVSNERYELFIKDCTSHGVDLTSFVKMCVKYVRLHGMVAIVVDNKKQDEALLKEDAIKRKLNPYCYIKKANEFNTDGITFDSFGNLETIMYFDHSKVEKANGENTLVNYYRYWDSEKSILYKEEKVETDDPTFEEKYTPIDEKTNALGKLPVYIMYEEALNDPTELYADTPRYQLAKINATIFNQDSEGREVERNQGFGILTIPEDGNGSEEKDKTLGTGNYLGYPVDSRNSPEMINVEPDLILALSEKRAKSMESLIEIAEQSGVQGITKSQDAKSGLAYAFEFFAYEATLKESSRIAAKIEKEIRNLFNDWTRENVEYDIDYPTNFKPNKTQEKYTQLTETMESPGITKQFKDKCEIEKYQLMFPEDEEGLEILKKQQMEVEPEFNSDQNIEDDNESES